VAAPTEKDEGSRTVNSTNIECFIACVTPWVVDDAALRRKGLMTAFSHLQAPASLASVFEPVLSVPSELSP
jgi:hypothetical protein